MSEKFQTGYMDKALFNLESVLRRAKKGIRKALAEQEARFRNSAIAGDMDALAALKQHMGEYRKIIDDDNRKELT